MRFRRLNAPCLLFKNSEAHWKSLDQKLSVRHISNASSIEKPYYVTSPIFYVNAAPHIGHLYTLVLTDVFKRFHALKGRKAILCTGTDEHGMKIQRAAQKAGQDVRAFCNDNYKSFEILAQKAGIQYDHFIRTSDPDHRFAVQHFWLMLQERGYIYSSKHEGWYSVSDETFYPTSGIHVALDPSTGRKFMASRETGKEVEWSSEVNYHFRLSSLRDRLLQHYSENPEFVQPATRMQDVIQHVTDGLSDLSISRPAERLAWGIPAPDDTTQTIYVWLDALINYLTKTNYPFHIPGQEHAAGWPADVHVIGKDIVRFHCIYWPAFLLALHLPLPKQIMTHAHWTLGQKKMSKSTGNVVNPFFALDRFGSDTMRYYLIRDGGVKDDSDYDNEYIIDRYKTLQGTLGNLVTRVVRGKGWNIRRAVEYGRLDDSDDGRKHQEILKELPSSVDHWMVRLQPGEALKRVLEVVNQTNQYMQHASPWTLASPTDEHGRPKADHKPPDVRKLDPIIHLCAESIRICAILLQPVMPGRMEHILDLIGVAKEMRMFQDTVVGGDGDFGVPMVDVGHGKRGVVFPPLMSDF
ncbi:MAG: hypothetical protein Q9219_004919 [cf. Caloplaca sp. 3 TL-2023]